MFVKRLCEKDQREREGKMNASLRDVVIQPVESRPDMERGHTESKDSGRFDKEIALAFLKSLRRRKLAVQRSNVDLLSFFVDILIRHRNDFLSPPECPAGCLLCICILK